MLEKLGEALKRATNKIARAVFLDKSLIDEVVKDLQRALISADVNVHLVKEITDKIKDQASDEKIKGIEKKEHMIKLLNDSILDILGREKVDLKLEEGQTRIMLLGLYGAGKTTTAAKLALYYGKRGKKVAAISLDVYRPAAADQLKQNMEKIKMPYFIDKDEKNPKKIWNKYKLELEKYDIVLIDTAGRHALDKDLISEISDLNKEIKPSHKILVLQADIGQAAKDQAAEFQKAAGINGVIVTRMDSTAKAGGALTACHETGAPVFFIGTGEKMHELESFNPKSFVNRILGMGDIEGLIEKVQTAADQESQERLKKNLEEGKLSLRDLQEQLKSMGSMGSLSKMAEMIPGFSKAKIPEGMLGAQEDKIKKWEHVINSMTEEEIQNPEILEKQTTRLGRIAKGSGSTTTDIRQLLKQYKMIQEFTKTGGSGMDLESGEMNQKQMMKLAKKFGKKVRF